MFLGWQKVFLPYIRFANTLWNNFDFYHDFLIEHHLWNQLKVLHSLNTDINLIMQKTANFRFLDSSSSQFEEKTMEKNLVKKYWKNKFYQKWLKMTLFCYLPLWPMFWNHFKNLVEIQYFYPCLINYFYF